MKIKTADLTGPALDWAVAQCESVEVEYINDGITRCLLRVSPFTSMYRPSVDWSQGGPLIAKEGTYLRSNDEATEWAAGALSKNRLDGKPGPMFYAETPLIAACRCLVASHLGDEVDVPDELV